MAKKKNTPKKHRFKHVEALESTTRESHTARSVSSILTVSRDFSYVTGDLRRIAVMAGSLVGLELILYYILAHTSLGTSIYHLVKI